ncbi:MAG TPA: acyl carrier protein [Candidatus Binataceae bacterium]|nr:acyl carrier protein [Candidatus Binataceae bacterium]
MLAAVESMASISREVIEDAIREILAEELEVDLRSFGGNGSSTPLLGRGIGLDSVDALTLISALENRFDVEVSDDDLTVGLFKTIGTLAEYIAGKVEERTGTPNAQTR